MIEKEIFVTFRERQGVWDCCHKQQNIYSLVVMCNDASFGGVQAAWASVRKPSDQFLVLGLIAHMMNQFLHRIQSKQLDSGIIVHSVLFFLICLCKPVKVGGERSEENRKAPDVQRLDSRNSHFIMWTINLRTGKLVRLVGY